MIDLGPGSVPLTEVWTITLNRTRTLTKTPMSVLTKRWKRSRCQENVGFCLLRNILKTRVGELGQFLNPGTVNTSVCGHALKSMTQQTSCGWEMSSPVCSPPASGRTGDIPTNHRHWCVDGAKSKQLQLLPSLGTCVCSKHGWLSKSTVRQCAPQDDRNPDPHKGGGTAEVWRLTDTIINEVIIVLLNTLNKL